MTFELDASLKRLATDYIDIYYLHRDDLETPLEETVSAIGDFIRAGKRRYFGLSNFDGWRIAEVVNTSRRLGVPQPIVLQPVYNAMNRLGEVEMFPACAYYGMGIVPYSPLARNVLTGERVGRVEDRLSPALPHQTVHAVCPHTAFRCSSCRDMRICLSHVY